jgi:Holliday junction resolvase RusA-like endonuclease
MTDTCTTPRLLGGLTAIHSDTSPVTVVIAGEPVAKARPRLTRRGIAYTPAHTRKYEAHGRLAAQLAMDGRPPIEGPVRVELVAELPIPVSWSQKKQARAITGDVLPISRPDLDNYLKSGLDSINEIVVRDDSQVVEVRARKRYSTTPKLVLTIFPLGGVTIFLPGGDTLDLRDGDMTP